MKELEELLKKSNNLISTQAPEVIEQYINWCLTSHIIGLVVCVFILFASVIAIWLGFSKRAYDSDTDFIYWILGGFGAFLSIVFSFNNIYYIVYINIAPKAYMIEQLTR